MPAPVVSWYDSINTVEILEWDLAVVDAGAVSIDSTFLIWNNRGGSESLSDMTNCSITTKDTLGGDLGPLVEEKWIEAKCTTANDQDFVPIGGEAGKHPIKALGQTENVIKGTANDALVDNSADNFAIVVCHANIPAVATSGPKEFLLRAAYQYI